MKDETMYAENTTNGDDGTPGFGVGIAVLSMLAATLLSGLRFARN
ncbi:PGF-CTERM sorting domain-containing protein [Natrarchaeobaculum sulfurireducens]|nr:PGF-CTERM sorting domain-containing protein [Natrarchaeobaculum sulfurireducens]